MDFYAGQWLTLETADEAGSSLLKENIEELR